MPPRARTNHLSFRGGTLVCSSRRSYRELEASFDPAESWAPEAFAFLSRARRRAVDPERRIIVETVNGVPAAASPYAAALAAVGFEADRGRMVLWQ